MADVLEEVKEVLRGYRPEDIRFNEPHFTDMLLLREGDRSEVVRHLLDPERLVAAERGRHDDLK